jgi:hypothetical protein
MTRALVCGGRDYNDADRVWQVLARVSPTVVIEGCAAGADRLAEGWAKLAGVTLIHFPADWRKHGKAAGPIRNKQMLGAFPDVVVAFPGGRGTENMVAQAIAAGVQVIKVDWP